jgi:hypothetical protein
MLRRVLGALGGLLLVAGLALLVYVKLRPIPPDAAYVGSAPCADCHRDEHPTWAVSQHQKMMRPADEPGVVVAHLEAQGLRFERNAAVWAIGGKWEQQFMGFDGQTETLLPGAWLELVGHWDLQSWDGWQVPIPRERCHGCHTVGLDLETGHFVEPNIGCESCHGPAEWHVRTLGMGRIYSGVESEVCGQCHTRGQSPSGQFFFPVGYRPGLDLAPHFVPLAPTPNQTSSYWWGNGVARKRHQEYPAWLQGGHSASLRSLREGYDGRYGAVTEECLSCHAGDYILASRGSRPSIDEAQQGVTCSVCHSVHGDLDQPRMGCEACHTTGAYYHQPERNADHVPCPREAGVGCVDCHMPKTVEIGGAYALHSHSPGIVTPAEGARWGMPSSCANGGCHADASPEELQIVFERHFP